MSNLNNVKSINLNHKKITDINTSEINLPKKDSMVILSPNTLLTEKSLPLNHSIQESLENKINNPTNNNLITYESVENSVQQNTLIFDKVLSENSEEYDLNVCYDVQLDFYPFSSTNEKILTIHQIINSSNNYISTTSITPGYSLVYTKDNKFKNTQDNNDLPYVDINSGTADMTYLNYRTTCTKTKSEHEQINIRNKIINEDNELIMFEYNIIDNNKIQLYFIHANGMNGSFDSDSLTYDITPIKGQEHIITSTNDYETITGIIFVVETRKTIYTKLNKYETISEDIYNKLLTTNALENTYINDRLLFANTLATNENNIDKYEIIGESDDDYELVSNSYANAAILNNSGYWFNGYTEIDSEYVFEINEQYKKGDVYYKYYWCDLNYIIYTKNSYLDEENNISFEPNYICINYLNLYKYSVENDKLYKCDYKYNDSWSECQLTDNIASFINQGDGHDKNILIKIEKTENQLKITLYLNDINFDPTVFIDSVIFDYNNINYFKYFELTVDYYENQIIEIKRDNYDVIYNYDPIQDINNYNIRHVISKTFHSDIKKLIEVDPEIKHKLITTDSISKSYMKEKLKFDNFRFDTNKYWKVNTNKTLIKIVNGNNTNAELKFSFDIDSLGNNNGLVIHDNTIDPNIAHNTANIMKLDNNEILEINISIDNVWIFTAKHEAGSNIEIIDSNTDWYYDIGYENLIYYIKFKNAQENPFIYKYFGIQRNNDIISLYYDDLNEDATTNCYMQLVKMNNNKYLVKAIPINYTLNTSFTDMICGNETYLNDNTYGICELINVESSRKGDDTSNLINTFNYIVHSDNVKSDYMNITEYILYESDYSEKYKLITTESLKDAYACSSIDFDKDKDKLVTVNALKSIGIIPKLSEMIMNNCYYGSIIRELTNELNKIPYNDMFDFKMKIDNNDILIYDNSNNNFVGRLTNQASNVNNYHVIITDISLINKYLAKELYYDFKFEILEVNSKVIIKDINDNNVSVFNYITKYALFIDDNNNYEGDITSIIKRYKGYLPKYINIDDENIIIQYCFYDDGNDGHVGKITFNSDKLIIGEGIHLKSNSYIPQYYEISLNDGSMIENIIYDKNTYTVIKDNDIYKLI